MLQQRKLEIANTTNPTLGTMQMKYRCFAVKKIKTPAVSYAIYIRNRRTKTLSNNTTVRINCG